MKTSKLRVIFAAFTLISLSCAEVTPKDKSTFIYIGSSHQQGHGQDDEVTICSLSGPESHVAIVTLVSATWEKRICGEELPDSRFRYVVDVSTPILGAERGRLELLGLQNFDWLPKSTKAGDQFLIAYRIARGENFLLQWAEMIDGESNTDGRMITLPPTIDELTTEIQKMRGSKCETNYIGFKSPFDDFIQPWGHTECGGYIGKIQEPSVVEGVDK